MATKNVTLLETFGDYVTDFNGLGSDVGDLTLLTTSTKASLVAAINELDSSFVVSINELDSNIGTRTSLTTTNKASLVSAINEVNAKPSFDSATVISISRAGISVTDAGGDGSLSYNSGSGVITYTGPSASEVRAKISVTDAGGDGSLSYDNSTGVLTYTGPSASEVRAKISVTDAGGDGSLSYDNSSGVLTYTGPSATEVRAHLSAGTRMTYSSGAFSIANGAIDQAAVANGAINSSKLTSAVALIIYNSAGSAVKTLYGAGS